MNGENRFTNNKYDINGFDINGIHRDTKTKYHSNDFDINGINKDINIVFNEDIDEKKMLENTLWLKNRYNFLKSFIKLIKEKDITKTVNNKVISLEIFKKFIYAILNGIINNNNIKEAYNQHLIDFEKYLDESKSSKNVDQLKNYLIKIKNLVNKIDTEEEAAENIANIYERRDIQEKKKNEILTNTT